MHTITERPSSHRLVIIVILVYGLLTAGYYVVRYAGQWMDSDTAVLTQAIAQIDRTNSLVRGTDVYNAGYAYQAISYMAVKITGLSVDQLQLLVYPFIAACLILVAFALYYELTGNLIVGALSALLLFLQPDFLFVIFRGSHEKITWISTMMAIYVFAKSLSAAHDIRRFIIYVGFFYLFIYGLISSNAFMGSSFIITIEIVLAASLILQFFLRKFSNQIHIPSIPRLVYINALAMILWFLIIFYFYPPASQFLYSLKSVAERSISVGLGEQPIIDPYATVARGWINSYAYLGIAVPTFTLAGISFLAWIRNGFQIIRKQSVFLRPQSALLWLLYAGFGVQLAISIILDLSGSLGGNFQLRIFPPMLLFAAPLTAQLVVNLWKSAKNNKRKLLAIGLSIFLFWASASSLLKSTNEPWLSNYWTFWYQNENAAAQWVDENLDNNSVWLGRISPRAKSFGFGNESLNTRDVARRDPVSRSFLISEVDKIFSQRSGSDQLPDVENSNRIYDNGQVVFYRLLPLTPFQK
jgi:hypothetical protein